MRNIFKDLDPNILRDRFAIKVKELKLQSQTVELIKAIPGIGGINAYAELTNGFITVRNIATVICLTLIAVLFVVSMFIISNTIKLTTFDRKDEIRHYENGGRDQRLYPLALCV